MSNVWSGYFERASQLVDSYESKEPVTPEETLLRKIFGEAATDESTAVSEQIIDNIG
jgi:hypothetical protein